MGLIDLYGNYMGFMWDLHGIYVGFIDDIPLVKFNGCLGL